MFAKSAGKTRSKHVISRRGADCPAGWYSRRNSQSKRPVGSRHSTRRLSLRAHSDPAPYSLVPSAGRPLRCVHRAILRTGRRNSLPGPPFQTILVSADSIRPSKARPWRLATNEQRGNYALTFHRRIPREIPGGIHVRTRSFRRYSLDNRQLSCNRASRLRREIHAPFEYRRRHYETRPRIREHTHG